MNLNKCPKCHYHLIEEEVNSHICKEVVDYRIEGNLVYFFDGEKWYPVTKITNRSFTDKKSTTDFTAPKTRFCYLYGTRKSVLPIGT